MVRHFTTSTGFTGEAASDFQLKDAGTGFELRGNVNRRRHTDAYGDLEFFLPALLGVFDEIVAIMAGSKADRHLVF